MGILSKEDYERRRESAARRMCENTQIKTLTKEQHDALAEICYIRHEIHSCNRQALFNYEFADYNRYWDAINTEASNENTIKQIIKEANLPDWNWSCDWNDYVTSMDEGIRCFDEKGNETKEYERAMNALYELVEHWNNSIEEYLLQIDKEHGTNYCPTGTHRYADIL